MDIIAEIGQAHEGSLGIAHSYIDLLADSGVNVVKFQTHIAEAESSEFENFRVNFSYEDATRQDYWKRMEFSLEQWKGLKEHCERKGLEFMSSPFSIAAVDLLEELGVKRYKIGSGEVNNFLLLDRIAKTGKPIIVSSGMSSFEELDETVNFLKSYGNPISIMQCTTSYPTQAEQWGLNVLNELKSRYNVPIGFSDHSGDIFAGLSAVILGAEFLEFHVVFDKRLFGPDSKSSLTFDQINRLTNGIEQIRRALSSPINKNDISMYSELKGIFEKSLAINKDLPANHILCLEDLESKKPNDKGIKANLYSEVIGRKLNKSLKKWDFLTQNDLLNE